MFLQILCHLSYVLCSLSLPPSFVNLATLHIFFFNHYNCVNVNISCDLSWDLHFSIFLLSDGPLHSSVMSSFYPVPPHSFLPLLFNQLSRSCGFYSPMSLTVISFFLSPLSSRVHPHWFYFNMWLCFLTGFLASSNRWILDSSASFTALKHTQELPFTLLKTPMFQLPYLLLM